jgi:DNA-binding transcriptional ArsR family regulator
MMPKELFWSGLKGGIFEQKHFRAIGNALWLFGWLCMRQSQINGSGEGLPHYGNPLTFKEISDDTGFSRRTIEKWTAVLTRTGYIHTKRIGNSGLIFFIHKAKQKAKNPKPKTRYFAAELQPNGNYAKVTDVESQVPANGRTPESQVPANEGARPRPLAYTQADKPLENQPDVQITNTLTLFIKRGASDGCKT